MKSMNIINKEFEMSKLENDLLDYKIRDFGNLNIELKGLISDCRNLIDDYDEEILQYGYKTYLRSGLDLDDFISKTIKVAGEFNEIIEHDNYCFEYQDTHCGKELIIIIQECLNNFSVLVDLMNVLSSQIECSAPLFEGQEEIFRFKANRISIFVDYAREFIDFIFRFYSKKTKVIKESGEYK